MSAYETWGVNIVEPAIPGLAPFLRAIHLKNVRGGEDTRAFPQVHPSLLVWSLSGASYSKGSGTEPKIITFEVFLLQSNLDITNLSVTKFVI